MNNIIELIIAFVKDRFNLSKDKEDYLNIIQSIEKGVEFRGINLWTLVFAILVASVGLNVNSTAVIIGAMLISPLMGPIMGLGLSVGINDFILLKRSLKNFSLAMIISVATSAVYFFISPLSDAQSELLARTQPTIYDVLIAFFGGMAGIVAGASKEKGNVIPGVAIATALMPPLCTAGFGIATGNLFYFIGALYLFFINSVMISLATLIVVRLLRFPTKDFIDAKKEQKVRFYIYIIVTITVIPSIYLGYQIVKQSIFQKNAHQFVQHEFNLPNTRVLTKAFNYNRKQDHVIELFLAGEHLDENRILEIRNKMGAYALRRTNLIVRQGMDHAVKVDVQQIKSGLLEDLYNRSERALQDKDEKIKLLEAELLRVRSRDLPVSDIGQEIYAINPKIKKISVSHSPIFQTELMEPDTSIIVFIQTDKHLNTEELNTIQNWLEKRLKQDSLKIIFEKTEK
ncbi:MAG: DUF389 domain-containing protein [Bacteroidales bacterium]